MSNCEHKLVFLRQEERKTGGFRPNYTRVDIFFCEKCASYKEVLAAELVQYGDGREEWIPKFPSV